MKPMALPSYWMRVLCHLPPQSSLTQMKLQLRGNQSINHSCVGILNKNEVNAVDHTRHVWILEDLRHLYDSFKPSQAHPESPSAGWSAPSPGGTTPAGSQALAISLALVSGPCCWAQSSSWIIPQAFWCCSFFRRFSSLTRLTAHLDGCVKDAAELDGFQQQHAMRAATPTWNWNMKKQLPRCQMMHRGLFECRGPNKNASKPINNSLAQLYTGDLLTPQFPSPLTRNPQSFKIEGKAVKVGWTTTDRREQKPSRYLQSPATILLCHLQTDS